MLNDPSNPNVSSRQADQNFLGATYATDRSRNMTCGNLPELLKSSNADAHRTLELVVDIMDPALTLSDYAFLVSRFYGFIKPWEDQLRSALSAELAGLFADRYKTAWLQQDLQDLQRLTGSRVAPPAISSATFCEKLPDMSTTPRLLGSAYVIEGSSLGSRLIAGHLGRRFASGPDVPHRYFDCYGSQTGSMWKKFLVTLMSRVPEENYSDAVDAAAQTFTCMTDWFTDTNRQPLTTHA